MDRIKTQARAVMEELIEKAGLRSGDLLVVGCSTSEVIGSKIGTNSSPDTAKQLFEGLYEVTEAHGIRLAAQCCEHLNRALIVETDTAEKLGLEPVWVVPAPKAGGSLATAAWQAFSQPVAVEHIRADAGLDIGDTFIGMHLKDVAVPVRLSQTSVGHAHLTAARCRPKLIGGERACYTESHL